MLLMDVKGRENINGAFQAKPLLYAMLGIFVAVFTLWQVGRVQLSTFQFGLEEREVVLLSLERVSYEDPEMKSRAAIAKSLVAHGQIESLFQEDFFSSDPISQDRSIKELLLQIPAEIASSYK